MSLKLKDRILPILLGTVSVTISLFAAQGQAGAFSFKTNLEVGSNAPEGDIWLKSVKLQDNRTVNQFLMVDEVTILQNKLIADRQIGDTHNPEAIPTNGRNNNTGAASTDKGDLATAPLAVSGMNDPTGAAMAAFLGNKNLNNIIDTEDNGFFKLNVSFTQAVSSLFLWERGMNSRIGIQALDAAGNLIGNFLTLDSSKWQYADYKIDTEEIAGAQKVGSLGISLLDLGVSGPIEAVQLTAQSSFNGPDFKIVGSTAVVPEPATLAGLGVVAGALSLRRRRKSQVS